MNTPDPQNGPRGALRAAPVDERRGADEAGAPTCTVVICTRDRPATLDRCLELLARQEAPPFDVLVVDNAPSDEAALRVATHHGVGYVREPEPGLSRARNAGARSCGAEVVVYLDDDAEPEPGWLAALLHEFADPAVAACGGPIAWFDMGEGEASGSEAAGAAPGPTRVLDRDVDRWYEKVNFGGMGSGSNMAFRLRALRAISGFHEGLGLGTDIPGGADNYAFFAVVRAGHRVVFTPNAVVRHPLPAQGAPLEARRRRDLAAAVAYWLYFLFEERGFRRATAAYLVRALLGLRRAWSAAPASRQGSGLGFAGSAAAGLLGTRFYLRSIVRRRVPSARAPQP
jgi:glycosyltransferase involved in cell wall biosynthesis